MSKIITHPQSRAYDEGWDAIFGKRAGLRELTRETEEAGGYAPEDELTALSQEMGLYPERVQMDASEASEPAATPSEPSSDTEREALNVRSPADAVNRDSSQRPRQVHVDGRKPRGWTPKQG